MGFALKGLTIGCNGLIVCILLTGCGSKYQKPVFDQPKLPTQVSTASDRDILKMQKKITDQGVKIIIIGQNYLISVPSTLLFANQSPKIQWEAYALLNNIACYVQQFRKISININGFSSKYVSSRREHALTLARTKEVSNYLWSQGVDSRFIFTQGLGSDKPIVGFTQRGDSAPNSRIEITFRQAIA